MHMEVFSMLSFEQEFRMKIKMLMAALALVAGGAALAQPRPAQPATPAVPGNPTAMSRVDQREANQERRIQQGVASGQLTPREASRLQNEQAHVQRAEQRARADGRVTPQERARLERMQDHASRDIAREKHDKQRDMNHDGRRDRPMPRR